MRETAAPTIEDLDISTVLHALSDPARLGIVALLSAKDEATCSELAPPGVTKSTSSHHLKVLREAGVTSTRTEGTYKFCRLRRDDLQARFPGLLDAVLAAAPRPEALAAGAGPAGTPWDC